METQLKGTCIRQDGTVYYHVQRPQQTSIRGIKTVVGEPLEHKIARIMDNQEPISDQAAIVYTERKDGVKPEYNIRTDRFDMAVDAMDNLSKSQFAKREEALKQRAAKENPTPPVG